MARKKSAKIAYSTLEIVTASLIGLLLFAAYAIKPGEVFPHGRATVTIVKVEKGDTISKISHTLTDEGVVRFAVPASIMISLFGGEHGLPAGAYVIQPNTTPLQAFWQLAHGNFGVEPVKITITEGATSYEIADTLDGKFIHFDKEKFAALAREREGYLFPDTYFLLPTATEEEILETMENNFKVHVAQILPLIQASHKSLSELVIVASLLEKEARSLESRRMIAGIIDNRLNAGMPLQIDAVFGYINKVDTFSPKFSDLEVDSPYNTYKNKGLPAGAIANPGLDAILAAATPTGSKYLYYLTGTDGVMRYAKTFEEHVRNRQKYLN